MHKTLVVICFLLAVGGVIAVSNDPLSAYLNNKGFDAYVSGDNSRALQLYSAGYALDLDRDDGIIAYNLGRLHEDNQDLSRARKFYEIALERDAFPGFWGAARVHYTLENYDIADFFLNTALIELGDDFEPTTKEESYHVYYLSGMKGVVLEKSDPAEALEYLEIAFALESNLNSYEREEGRVYREAEFHCVAAKLYESQSQGKALEQWEECLRLLPSSLTARGREYKERAQKALNEPQQ